MPRGTVLELHRWPVKSMAGERVAALDVGEHGAAGDRRHAVWLRGGRRLTARLAPRLLGWRAELDGSPDPRVTAPAGRVFAWDAALERELGAHLGRDVALVRDPGGMQDVRGTLLVTVEGSRRRLEEELGAPVDVRRFRPNVHVEVPDAEPFAESAWEGRVLRAGGVELEIVHACDRCAITIHDPDSLERRPELLRRINEDHGTFFGVRARARTAGRIAVGDPVELRSPARVPA